MLATIKEKKSFLSAMHNTQSKLPFLLDHPDNPNHKIPITNYLFSIVKLPNGDQQLRLCNELRHGDISTCELLSFDMKDFFKQFQEKTKAINVSPITNKFNHPSFKEHKGLIQELIDASLAHTDLFTKVEHLPVLAAGKIETIIGKEVHLFINHSLDTEERKKAKEIAEEVINKHAFFQMLFSKLNAKLVIDFQKKSSHAINSTKHHLNMLKRTSDYQPLSTRIEISEKEFKELKPITRTTHNSKKVAPSLKKAYLTALREPAPNIGVYYKLYIKDHEFFYQQDAEHIAKLSRMQSFVIIEKEQKDYTGRHYFLEFRISPQSSHILGALQEEEVKKIINNIYEKYELPKIMAFLIKELNLNITPKILEEEAIYEYIANSNIIDNCQAYPVVAAGEIKHKEVLNDFSGAYYIDVDRALFLKALSHFNFLKEAFFVKNQPGLDAKPNANVYFFAPIEHDKKDKLKKPNNNNKPAVKPANNLLFFKPRLPNRLTCNQESKEKVPIPRARFIPAG